MTQIAPSTDIDIFSDEVSHTPYSAYRELRALGPVVRFAKHNCLALTRYADVRAAGSDHERFSSAQGVGLLDELNVRTRGTVLASDPPEHTALRAVLSEKLSPRALGDLRGHIEQQVDAIVAEAVALGTFDAVPALTARIPVQIVADLIGLPQHGRELLLPGADAMFNGFGPLSPRLAEGQAQVQAYFGYVAQATRRDQLLPGSWGAAIYDAVDDGRLRPEQALPLMSAYLVAGMDTTVNSLGFLVQHLAQVPGLWQELKADPVGVGRSVFNETLRFESPVQAFFRTTRGDFEIEGTAVPDGSRIALLYGCANRDERKWGETAERYSAARNPSDHLAFGYGTHSCAGASLARLEAQALINALARRVERLELAGEPRIRIHPIVRGLESLPVRLA